MMELVGGPHRACQKPGWATWGQGTAAGRGPSWGQKVWWEPRSMWMVLMCGLCWCHGDVAPISEIWGPLRQSEFPGSSNHLCLTLWGILPPARMSLGLGGFESPDLAKEAYPLDSPSLVGKCLSYWKSDGPSWPSWPLPALTSCSSVKLRKPHCPPQLPPLGGLVYGLAPFCSVRKRVPSAP